MRFVQIVVFADKGNASPAYWYGLCCMDRDRCGRYRIGGHTDLQGTCYYMEVIFYCNADRFNYRFESSISLKQKTGYQLILASCFSIFWIIRITSLPVPSPVYYPHHKVRCHHRPVYRKTSLHSGLSSHGLLLPYPDKPS